MNLNQYGTIPAHSIWVGLSDAHYKIRNSEMTEGDYNIKLTDDNFDQKVLSSKIPFLVEFGADWCGTCHIIAPLLEELAKEYNGILKIGKLDVEENPQSKQTFGIHELPTLLFFKDGKVIDHIIGAVPKYEMTMKIQSIIDL